jgi:hypothetical protein
MQSNITNSQFLVGAFVLALAFIFALAAYLEFRKRKAPKFRNFFAYENHRDILRDGSTKTNILLPLDRHSHLVNFHLREFAASEQRIGSSIGVQPDPE